MYILNIDVLPVSAAFKHKLSATYTVVEKCDAGGIDSANVVGLYCRFAIVIDDKILQKYPNLKFVACNATGIEHIDKKACENKGITIYSLENAAKFLSENVTSSAEHTWCLTLAASRKLKSHQIALHNNEFDRNQNFGIQLKGKILGLIGLGRNGLQIAKYATAFDMVIKYYDPYKTVSLYEKVEYLEQLFAESDILIISCKLTEETRLLIDYKVLRNGDATILINTSRGEIVCEDDVLDALDSGHLASYATDVIVDESNALKSKMYLRSLIDERILVTPHIGGATLDAWSLTECHIADMILSTQHIF